MSLFPYAYDPKSLPVTSSLQVFVLEEGRKPVDLDGTATIFNLDSHYFYKASKSILLTGENVIIICDLWRQLPQASSARCHMPPFGLHFIADSQIHTMASICWECNNIFLVENNQRKLYGFDSSSNVGQQLFQMLTAYTQSV